MVTLGPAPSVHNLRSITLRWVTAISLTRVNNLSRDVSLVAPSCVTAEVNISVMQ